MSSKICIVSIDAAFANASAIQRYLNCEIALQHIDVKGFHAMLTKTPYGLKNIPKAEHYIFAGSGVLTRVDIDKLNGRKTVIISDSHYLRQKKDIDQIIKDHNIEVFCMADLWEFCDFEKKVFVHPMPRFHLNTDKANTFTICHSPYKKVNTNQKGSAQIGSRCRAFLESNEIKGTYIEVVDKTWGETLLIKSKSHFFIDQISYKNHLIDFDYKGGIGKSGLEAMLLKCLTFSSGDKIESDIEEFPFIQVWGEGDLQEKLKFYYNEKEFSKKVIEEQYQWAKKYTDLEFVTNRLIS